MGSLSPRAGRSPRADSGSGFGRDQDHGIDEIALGPAGKHEETLLDASSEISYLYLTFRRPLPRANTTLSSSSSAPPPPPPDLSPFLDPLLWPRHRKYLMLALSCVATFLTAYTAGAYSPPTPLMQASLDGGRNVSEVGVRAGISTFCAGFALAPMVLAPLSEINGRYPVFAVSGVIYVVFQAVCGLVDSLAGMLVARLLVGVGGSVFSSMVGGVIADLWDKAGRNTPMALFSGSVLVGTGAGPLVAAVITHRLGNSSISGIGAAWKWVFWHQVIAGGVVVIALVCFFSESRGSVVLSRKARAVNKWYEELEQAGYYGVWVEDEEEEEEESDPEKDGEGNDTEQVVVSTPDEEKGQTRREPRREPRSPPLRVRWLVKEDEERSSLGKMISISVYRPFHFLCTEPVVFFFSLWVAFAWAVLYITFGSVPLVFGRQYGWDIERAGYVFVAMMVGSVVATGLGIWQEGILHHPGWQPDTPSSSPLWTFLRRRFPANAPESRLYFTCISSTLLPVSLFMFGFTARPDVHWMVPTVAVGLATIGIFTVYLAVFNYFADTYHRYASSVIAAQSFCRNVMGGAFPLVTTPLFTNLGEARAGCLLGGIAAGLTVVPWVLVFFGERIRARSPFASKLEKS